MIELGTREEDPRMKLTLADMALKEVPAKATAKVYDGTSGEMG